jgi:hypothetical protein
MLQTGKWPRSLPLPCTSLIFYLEDNLSFELNGLCGGEYYWMAANFIKYKYDATRFTFISYGVPEWGNVKWCATPFNGQTSGLDKCVLAL